MISVCLDPSMTVPCTTLFHGNSGTSSSYSSPLFLVGVGDVLFFQAVFLACTPFSLSEVITTRIDITGEKRGSTVAWHRRRVETGDTWLQASDMCRRFDELYNTGRNRFNLTRVWECLCVYVSCACVNACMYKCMCVCRYVVTVIHQPLLTLHLNLWFKHTTTTSISLSLSCHVDRLSR